MVGGRVVANRAGWLCQFYRRPWRWGWKAYRAPNGRNWRRGTWPRWAVRWPSSRRRRRAMTPRRSRRCSTDCSPRCCPVSERPRGGRARSRPRDGRDRCSVAACGGERARWWAGFGGGGEAAAALRELFWWAASPAPGLRPLQPRLLRALYLAPPATLQLLTPQDPPAMRKVGRRLQR